MSDGLFSTRRRGVFLAKAVLLATAAGGLLLLGSMFVVGLNALIGFLCNLRNAIGIPAQPGRPDYLVLGTLGTIFILIGGLILFLLLKYHQAWNGKVCGFWVDRDCNRRFSRVYGLSDHASSADNQLRHAYLKSLLKTREWSDWYATMAKSGLLGFKADIDTDTLSPEDADTVAVEVFKEIKQDIAERAFSVGLVVGISRTPLLDRVTIVAAALELQYHVLTRLGKRPTFRTWRMMVNRTLSSLFFNLYLSREECSEITILLKGAALGIVAGTEAAENAIDSLSEDLDLDGGGDIIGAGMFVLKTTVGISRAGATVLAQTLNKAGDDIMEGLLAGGILYYHGASLAAECLAQDRISLGTEAYALSPQNCVEAGLQRAGAILKNMVEKRRSQYRDRRKQAWTAMKGRLPRWLNSRLKEAEDQEPAMAIAHEERGEREANNG